MIKFSLILACYNEGPTFEKSIEKIVAELKKLKINWEIVFVEDKSTDDTRDRVIKLSKVIKNSRLLLHNKNQGRGKTVSDVLAICRGIICGYMDVDCEISPRYLGAFIKQIESGKDVALARRFYQRSFKNVSREITSRGYSLLLKYVLNLPIEDTEAGFKFFKRTKIIPVLLKTQDYGWFWDTEICARSYLAGLQIAQINVKFVRREDKKSTVKIFSDSVDYAKKLWSFRTEYQKLKLKNA